MRILFVITDSDIGGAEKLLQYLVEEKRPEDRVGVVVLMQEGELAAEYKAVFDEVVHLGFTYSSRNIFKMVKKLKIEINRFAPDVVSSHLFHADIVTALVGIKIPKTTTVHTQKLGQGVHPLTKIIARTVGLLSGRFRAVVPTSDSAEMKTFLKEYRYKNVVQEITNVAKLPTTVNYDLASKTFVSIGRNHPVKGHKILLQAFKVIAEDNPDWTLDIYGPGIDAENAAMQEIVVRAHAEDLFSAGRIKLKGATSDTGAVLEQSAGLIISSLYGETFPVVGVEAAAYGVPVISTNVGSCETFIDDQNFLVEPGNVHQLAKAMSDFINLDVERRTELSALARQRAERNYSAATAYKKYKDLFSNITGGNLK